jgi:two-component system response regulator
MRAASHPLTVLVAEDDPIDRMLVEEAFASAELPHSLSFVMDGQELLAYLAQACAGRPDRPLPDLILLDLNMPRKNGHEALAGIQARSQTAHIPVVVLTTSRAPADIRKAYELGAASFVVKPAEFELLTDCVGRVVRYWLEVTVHPPSHTQRRRRLGPSGGAT